jgi:biotin/methionine sulfoxide reductase
MSRRRNLTMSHWGTYELPGQEGKGEGIAGVAEDPDPSPIGLAMGDAYRDGPRIKTPAVRAGWLKTGPGERASGRGREPFVEVSWEDAFTLVARELRRIADTHGNSAIYAGSYGWASAGRFHHAQSQLRRFMNLVGGCTVHRQTYSYAAAQTLLPHVVADMQGYLETHHSSWDVIAAHTRLFVAFGGLPAKNSQMSVGGASEHRLRAGLAGATAKGCRFVNFSVVRSGLDLPTSVCEWIPIRPNTDTAVMLALACEIVRAGRHDRTFLDQYCTGFTQWERYLLGRDDGVIKDAEWAGPIAHVDPERIRSLALDMARELNGKRTMVNAAWSLQRADHGEQPFWALVALAAVVGQIGLPGGGFGVGYGCENGFGSPHPLIATGLRFPARPNPVKTFIPVARIVDMLEHPGTPFEFDGQRLHYPDIRLVYWAGGNPFHHHQDLNRLLVAWRRPETIVVHEQVWNAHAKLADIVLPASATLEREDIGFAYREPLIVAMRRLRDPPGKALDDHAIFAGIAEKLGVAKQFTEDRSPRAWLELLWEKWRATLLTQGFDPPEFNAFWSAGLWHLPAPSRPVVMLEEFRADPLANRLQTPSGRIEIYSERIATFGYTDCPPLPTWLEPSEWLGAPLAARYPLHMISDQPHNKLHSQLDFSTLSKASKVQGREPIWINPTDAGTRGISEGDVVRVFNDRGACLAGALLTDAIVAGVVKLSTGAWWDPMEFGVPGSLDKHGNPNVLTHDLATSSLAQACSAQSCLVQIERFSAPVPAITAFESPVVVPLTSESPPQQLP